MGQYNEILVGRYNRLFQKLFGMKGGAPAPQLPGMFKRMFHLSGSDCGTSKDGAFRSRRWDGDPRRQTPVACAPHSARCDMLAVIEKVWLWVGTADNKRHRFQSLRVTTGSRGDLGRNQFEPGRSRTAVTYLGSLQPSNHSRCSNTVGHAARNLASLHGRESRVGRDQHGHRGSAMLPARAGRLTPGRSTRPWRFGLVAREVLEESERT